MLLLRRLPMKTLYAFLETSPNQNTTCVSWDFSPSEHYMRFLRRLPIKTLYAFLETLPHQNTTYVS